MTSTRCYIDFAAGDKSRHDAELSQYNDVVKWLEQNGERYGLPAVLRNLDSTARESLAAIYEAETKVSESILTRVIGG